LSTQLAFNYGIMFKCTFQMGGGPLVFILFTLIKYNVDGVEKILKLKLDEKIERCNECLPHAIDIMCTIINAGITLKYSLNPNRSWVFFTIEFTGGLPKSLIAELCSNLVYGKK